jgi:hypothetical protein
VQTDTVFDEDGVPVSVRPGARGFVVEIDGFPQVLCATHIGPLVVGVPVEHLVLANWS